MAKSKPKPGSHFATLTEQARIAAREIEPRLDDGDLLDAIMHEMPRTLRDARDISLFIVMASREYQRLERYSTRDGQVMK